MKWFRLLSVCAVLLLVSGCASFGNYYEEIYNSLAFRNRMNVLPQQQLPEEKLTYAQYRQERDRIMQQGRP